MNGFIEKFVVMLIAVALLAVFGLIVALPLQLCWNLLMPDIFGVSAISFWQAYGLLFLSWLLFGSKQ